MNPVWKLRKEIETEIKKIPKENRVKFQADYIKLIQLAQREDYENFNLE